MAIVDKKGGLHGTVAHVVYRTVGDLQVVQSRPRRFKQTLATRESGVEFGLGSNTACIIRNVMESAYHSVDRGMGNRLTATVLKCIRSSKEKFRGERDIHDGNPSFLKGFQFNANSPLSEVLEVRPVVSTTPEGKVQIRIPAFDSHRQLHNAPAQCSNYTLRLLATAFHFRSEYSEYLDYHDIEFARGSYLEEQVWTLDKELPAGCLVLLSVSLFALNRTRLSTMVVNTPEWSPAEVVEAIQVPQGDQEMLDPDYIGGKNLWKHPEREPYKRTGSPFEKYPLTAYHGKDLFSKIERHREKASVQDLDKLNAAREELQKRLQAEQARGAELPLTSNGLPALPPLKTGRKTFGGCTQKRE
ncbi:hypothetical protein [Arcticibacter sp. MXS-1]|uniref:hypothetical protein n=1 Tax=Arcticibacter sp. MXS-1 TaxID=3341726 RepID=UPI0035A94764